MIHNRGKIQPKLYIYGKESVKRVWVFYREKCVLTFLISRSRGFCMLICVRDIGLIARIAPCKKDVMF